MTGQHLWRGCPATIQLERRDNRFTDMAKHRKTRAIDDTEAPTRVRLEVARASTLRLAVRATTKRDDLITVSITLLVDEYRRLLLWQYLHRDDVNSISMATRHLLCRQLPDDLIILRRRHVDAATPEPEGDPDVEELPTGALRAMPRPITDSDAVTKFRCRAAKRRALAAHALAPRAQHMP